MDLRSLRYFAEVATTLSFSRAAVQLHRSQPALSRCISDLEAELGLELFEREGRRVALSAGGRELLDDVRRLLRDADSLAEHARLLRSGRNLILRVGGAANTIERAVPDLMLRFRKIWPNVEIFLRPDGGTELLAAIERGEIDVGITRHVLSDFLGSRIAFPSHLIAVVPSDHRLARKRALAVEDLEGERLLAAPVSFTSRMLLEAACQSARIRPRIALETLELNALIALAEASQGIAVVPSTVDTAGRAVSVLPILAGKSVLGSWTAVVWNKRRKPPDHVAAFIELAANQLRRNYPGKAMRLPALDPILGVSA